MSKLTKSAKGQECLVRIPGHCNFDPATTVLCHLPGGGIARKQHDIHAAFGCSGCHDALDGRVKTRYSQGELKLMHLEGMKRTQDYWLEQRLITAR